jgi:hypothetical protein
MIATILKSSSTFSAVNYNERKVSKGAAELVEIANFGYLQKTGNLSASNLREYLMKYSSINQNIKNTQFHVAISCKKQDYTHDQLIEIAHQYLKEMGYAKSGQPILIYAHHDTANNHIHIVTSRVAPDGKKIDDHNERLRSQAVLNKILKIESKRESQSIIQQALLYSFESLGQYQAILEGSGYESFVEDDILKVKKGGTVLESIAIQEIENVASKKSKEETSKRRKQLKAIILKYKRLSSDKNDLKTMLKKKFGIGLVFVGKKDAPYGYIIVDHKNKTAYKGSDILELKSLLNFGQQTSQSKDSNEEAVNNFIHNHLVENDRLTIGDLNQALWSKYRVNVYHDGSIRGKRHKMVGHVRKENYEILRKNFRRQWIQIFNPTTEEEREVLCKFGHIDDIGSIDIVPERNTEKADATISHIKEIMNTAEKGQMYDDLRSAKIVILRKEEAMYAIDMGSSTIVNLRDTDIDLSPFMRHERGANARSSHIQTESRDIATQTPTANLLRSTGSDHHANREWEVGGFDNWDNIDDEKRMKR